MTSSLSVQECTNPCCNATTCKFKEGSQCADGECCDNCKVSTYEIKMALDLMHLRQSIPFFLQYLSAWTPPLLVMCHPTPPSSGCFVILQVTNSFLHHCLNSFKGMVNTLRQLHHTWPTNTHVKHSKASHTLSDLTWLIFDVISRPSTSTQISPRTQLCRRKQDECDLAEYCDGERATCPEDVFAVNGLPCDGDLGYCYNGKCPQRPNQCVRMYGPSEYLVLTLILDCFIILKQDLKNS